MPDVDFEPRMPEVDARPNLDTFFAKTRATIANPDPKAGIEPGQRCMAVVTPGRLMMMLPAPKPGAVPAQFVEQAQRLVPSDQPMNVVAVSFTDLKAMMADKLKCIPNLPQLLGLAFLGHSVFVFEGHPSAFETALAGADALIVDSAMIPFLQTDWAAVALRLIPQRGRVLVFNRKNGVLTPVVKSKDAPGWRLGDPDGEASYANCLLTTLAKRTPIKVQVTAGQPAPDLSTLAVDPAELEWVAELPFNYARLDASRIIAIIRQFAKLGDAAAGKLRTKLLTTGGKMETVTFELTVEEDGRVLKVEKV
jgi:hypothetical protein